MPQPTGAKGKTMTKEIELAKRHGIQYRMTPEGATEMWCYDRNLQAFAEALVAAEREACANIDPSGLNIQVSDMPHTVWEKYRGAILARSNAQGDAPPLGGRGRAQS